MSSTRTDHIQVINLDLLTYAGNLANLADVQKDFPERYRFIKGDISDKELVQRIFETSPVDGVVHFAAESHVDRSILGPEAFVRTNIYGTFNLLETCRRFWLSSPRATLAGKTISPHFHGRGLRFPGEHRVFHGAHSL